MTKLIGDIHGKMNDLFKICDAEPSVQFIGIGDVGIGFGGKDVLPSNFKFIRGNHDNPRVSKLHPHFITDYGMYGNAFLLGGADSIDKKWRTENVDWWRDEELTGEELDLALEAYVKARPDILISHEAPFAMHHVLKAANELKHGGDVYGFGPVRGTRTAFMLDEMIKQHAPKYAIFGHWHINISVKPRNKTQYICLDELCTMELPN
jgi:hypothetical protein